MIETIEGFEWILVNHLTGKNARLVVVKEECPKKYCNLYLKLTMGADGIVVLIKSERYWVSRKKGIFVKREFGLVAIGNLVMKFYGEEAVDEILDAIQSMLYDCSIIKEFTGDYRGEF